MASPRPIRALALAVLAVVALAVAPASARAAATKVATYATPGCDGAPTWRLAYRAYFRDSSGRTVSRGSRWDQARGEAKEFAVRVGRFSQCGVRVTIDVFDMGDAVWPGDYPSDARSFLTAGGYDRGIYRHPGPGYGGFGGGSTDVTHNAEFGIDDTASTHLGHPWSNLLMHEWLHMVVGFYDRVSWPEQDVHGACWRPDYADDLADGMLEGCMVNSLWFAHLMTGCIDQDGSRRGIARNAWAFYGAPAAPLNAGAAPPPAAAVTCATRASLGAPPGPPPKADAGPWMHSVRASSGRRLTVRLRTVREARGRFLVRAVRGSRRVTIPRRARRGGAWTYARRLPVTGSWKVSIRFIGAAGWQSRPVAAFRIRARR